MNPFDKMYAEGLPPWEIGRPQPVVETLLGQGAFTGDVLDIGCGTGENTMLLAQRGHVVVGVDVSERAIKIARQKATSRRISVRFFEHDALELAELGRTFDTLLDCALFHVFSDDARAEYKHNLEAVAHVGTQLHVICFSDAEPDWGGPRRVSERELRATFKRHWVFERLVPVTYQNRMNAAGSKAWHASLIYTGAPGGAKA